MQGQLNALDRHQQEMNHRQRKMEYKLTKYFIHTGFSMESEGLVNMEDNENAEFKIFHCMQLLHHAYNHCFAKDTITCIYTTKHASKTLFILTFQPHQAFK